MNVAMNIDVANIEQVEALEVFMRKLGGHPSTETLTKLSRLSMLAETLANVPTDQVDDKTKADRARRAAERKAKAQAVVEEVVEEESEEEEDFLGEEEDGQIPDLNPTFLRELTASKCDPNMNSNAENQVACRKAVKEKLSALGVSNVTSIPEESYLEYYQFIRSL